MRKFDDGEYFIKAILLIAGDVYDRMDQLIKKVRLKLTVKKVKYEML